MQPYWQILLAVLFALLPALSAAQTPTQWIEPATGHRVVRLSAEDGARKLYFHQNAFTESGDKLLIIAADGPATVDMKTYKIESLGIGRAMGLVVGKKSRQVYYSRDNLMLATHLDTRKTREIGRLVARGGSRFAVNADETLLAGSSLDAGVAPRPSFEPREAPQAGAGEKRNQEASLEKRWAARQPMRLFTVEIGSGKITAFAPSTDWLNHVQFSPTDPSLIMFCHEGPWHKVDRIWTIRSDGSGLQKLHARTMDMEIAGHEFFAPDGKTVWYDLQTPRGKEFWLAGRVLGSEKTIRYKVARDQWSVHYNISPDGKQFAGDGGGPHSVAAPGNGQWLYLFTPRDGVLEGEKLVDLSRHDYALEPNVDFTPDGKWIVFQANMQGKSHVYAVEVAKAR